MPLSKKEFEKISKAVVTDKLTAKRLLTLLETEYVNKNQARYAYDKPDPNNSHIHIIRANPIPVNESEQAKRERERGFKVRTPSESQTADNMAKNFKPVKFK